MARAIYPFGISRRSTSIILQMCNDQGRNRLWFVGVRRLYVSGWAFIFPMLPFFKLNQKRAQGGSKVESNISRHEDWTIYSKKKYVIMFAYESKSRSSLEEKLFQKCLISIIQPLLFLLSQAIS